MAEVKKTTESKYKDRILLIRDVQEWFQFSINLVDGETLENMSQFAVLLLTLRIYRLLDCSTDLMVEGFYESSLALLRVALEDCCLAAYLADREAEARAWIIGKRISPKTARSAIGFPDEPYRFLSDRYIHPNIEGFVALLELPEEGRKERRVDFEMGPHFNVALFEDCYSFTLGVLFLMMNSFQNCFKNLLGENEQWSSDHTQINGQILKHLGIDDKKHKTFISMKEG